MYSIRYQYGPVNSQIHREHASNDYGVLQRVGTHHRGLFVFLQVNCGLQQIIDLCVDVIHPMGRQRKGMVADGIIGLQYLCRDRHITVQAEWLQPNECNLQIPPDTGGGGPSSVLRQGEEIKKKNTS